MLIVFFSSVSNYHGHNRYPTHISMWVMKSQVTVNLWLQTDQVKSVEVDVPEISTRYADHFSQFLLTKSSEASSKNLTCCILYNTLLNSSR